MRGFEESSLHVAGRGAAEDVFTSAGLRPATLGLKILLPGSLPLLCRSCFVPQSPFLPASAFPLSFIPLSFIHFLFLLFLSFCSSSSPRIGWVALAVGD